MIIMYQTQPKYKQKNTLFESLTFTGKTCSPLLHYHFVNHANSCGNAIANSPGLLHAETGFSYFGVRYYDSDLMMGWLSVDPMADKYPSLSPYTYCGETWLGWWTRMGRRLIFLRYQKICKIG